MDLYFSENNSGDIDKNKNGKGTQLKTYRPLTIKQVKLAEVRTNDDSVCYVNNEETTDMTIIGVVRSITRHDSYVVYTIEDGTGAVDTIEWMNNGVGTSDMKLDEGGIIIETYVRVSGRIRFFNGKPQNVNAFKISPIHDHNEVSYHFLNAVYVHLSRTVKPMDIMYGFKRGEDKIKSEEALVKYAMQELTHTDAGVYIHSLVMHLKDHLSEPKIKVIIGRLEDQGEIFQTIDSEHLKLVDQ